VGQVNNWAFARWGAIVSVINSVDISNLQSQEVANSRKPTNESATEKARRERRRALVLPREHGAWGLLLVPMFTGAGVALHQASQVFPLILLLTAALALFWLRTPLESLLGTSAMRAQTLEESHTLRSVIVVLGGVAALALAGLLWAGRNAGLWPLGAAVAAAFIAQAILKKISRRTRILSEMVGTIGLTASAPAAYYVISGQFDDRAWMLWLANILFGVRFPHVSVGTLHRAIADQECTIAEWVWARRLDGVHADLVDPGCAHRTIGDIAFSWGFVDASHFSRAFRARFGATARAVRAGAPRTGAGTGRLT